MKTPIFKDITKDRLQDRVDKFWFVTFKYLHRHSYNPGPCYKLFLQLK